MKNIFVLLFMIILLPACGGGGGGGNNSQNTNIPPIANADSFSLAEGASANFVLVTNDSDADDGLNLGSIHITSAASDGTVIVNANGSIDYTHDGSENPTDSLSYTIEDVSGAVSNTAIVSFNITPVNDAPIAIADSSYNVSVAGTLNVTALSSILANDTDAENDSLTAVLDVTTSHGTLDLHADGSFDYVHDGSANFSDSFTYHANDGQDSNIVSVSITIYAGNAPPAALADSYTVAEGGTLTITAPNGVLVNDVDAENDSLTAVLDVTTSHGGLTLDADGSFEYVHDGSETLSDSFTYHANDGQDSNVVSVSISVTAVNDVPVAIADTGYSVAEGGTLTITAPNGVLVNDVDADSSLTAVPDVTTSNGSLTLNANGSFIYVHDGSETLSDSFTYHANDGHVDSNVVSVSINIIEQNDAPVAVSQGITINEDSPAVIHLGTDADGDSLTSSITVDPAHGVISGIGADVTYTPEVDNSDDVTFSFSVSDGVADSSIEIVTITITAVNDAPVANDAGIITSAGKTAVSDTLSASDTDSVSLTYQLLTLPTKGTVTLDNAATGAFTYTPSSLEEDSFTFNVNDNAAGDARDSNVATITITPPVAMSEPAAPTNLAAVAGDQRVSLSWNAVDYAESYNVYWSLTSPMTNTTLVTDVGTPYYYHDGVSNNTPYYYIVTAVNAEGESLDSTEISSTPLDIAISSLSFTDTNLDTCVTEEAAAVPATNVHELISLDCNVRDISDLSGLEQLTSLTSLKLYNNFVPDINDNSFTDISPLAALTQLTELSLNYVVNIDGISPLIDMVNLTELLLSGTGITDISALAGMSNMITLYAHNNNISDLRPISSMTSLIWANLAENHISDLDPLSAMADLNVLDLRTNHISDIDPLSAKPALTALHLLENNIFDLSALSTSTSLDILHLNDNNIFNVDALSGMTILTILTLDDNSIYDLAPLSGLVDLNTLFLARNQIVDVSPLASMVDMDELILQNNNIGGEGVGLIDELITLTVATEINLTDNITMSCSELTVLVTELGSIVVPITPNPGVNCTAP